MVHRSNPLKTTLFPVPSGPVFVPEKVQWYRYVSASATKLSMVNVISGKASIYELAVAANYALPFAGVPPFTVNAPSSA